MANPRNPGKQFVQISQKETTYGTAATIANAADIISEGIKPAQGLVEDPAMSADAMSPKAASRVTLWHEGDIVFPVNWAGGLFARLLYGALGKCTKTGTSAPFTYTFLEDFGPVPSYSLESCKGNANSDVLKYLGLSCFGLTLRGAASSGQDGIIQATANCHAKSVNAEAAKTSLTFPTVSRMLFSQNSFVDDGFAVDADMADVRLTSWELSIQRQVKKDRLYLPLSAGGPYMEQPLDEGKIQVSLTLEEEFKTMAAYNAVLAAAAPLGTGAPARKGPGLKMIGPSFGAQPYSLEFWLGNGILDDFDWGFTGYGIPHTKVRWKALYDAGDLSCMEAVLITDTNLTLYGRPHGAAGD